MSFFFFFIINTFDKIMLRKQNAKRLDIYRDKWARKIKSLSRATPSEQHRPVGCLLIAIINTHVLNNYSDNVSIQKIHFSPMHN
jgi:thermostable 8-oxoguanine DNA glycosylase